MLATAVTLASKIDIVIWKTAACLCFCFCFLNGDAILNVNLPLLAKMYLV